MNRQHSNQADQAERVSQLDFARAKRREDRARAAYNADVAERPYYNNGQPRRHWEDIGDVAQWSWGRS